MCVQAADQGLRSLLAYLSSTMLRHLIHLTVIALSAWMLLACGDDDDTTTKDTAGVEDLSEEVSDADVTESDADDDADDVENPDTTDTNEPDLYDDPIVYSVVKTNSELREIVYMQYANSITLPDMKIRVEDLHREPLVGMTIAYDFSYPGSRAEPKTSITDEDGLTEMTTFSLTGDLNGDTAKLFLTPYLKDGEPNQLSERAIEAYAIQVELEPPTDADGEPLTLIADGTSTYPFAIRIGRTGDALIPAELEVELSLILDAGYSPLLFADTSEMSRRWAVDPNNPDILFDMVSPATQEGTLHYRINFFQLGSLRGNRTNVIPVVTQ